MNLSIEIFANNTVAKYAAGIGGATLALTGVFIGATQAVENYEEFRQGFMSCSVVNPQDGEGVMTLPTHADSDCRPRDYSLFNLQLIKFNEPIDGLGIQPGVSSKG